MIARISLSLFLLLATTTTIILEVSGAAETAGLEFPKILSVITTRDVTSQYNAKWDIKHKGSKRLRNINEETVQLRIIAHTPEDLNHFDSLQQSGLLSYELEEAVNNNENDLEEDNNDVHLRRHHRQQRQRDLLGINQNLYCYRTVNETYNSMDALATNFPNLVTVKSIGQSYLKEQNPNEGYDIKIMIIGDTSASASTTPANMMVVGGHHSRELPPPETLMRWAEHLVTNYGRDADITWILQRTQIHVLPIANPDGRHIVQDNLGWYYRKNARPNTCARGAQRYGVDLNRNYPLFWGDSTGAGTDPCDTDYHGSKPLSEPESYAIYLYANALFDDSIKKGFSQASPHANGIFRGNPAIAMSQWEEECPTDKSSGIFIDVHSNGDFVYFPWGYRDKASPNHLPYLTASAKLAHPGNYQLWGPEQDGFLYFVSGDVTDSTYGIDCVFSVGYEIGSQMYANCTELKNSIVPIMEKSLLYAAKCASAPYQIPLGPDVLKVNVESSDPNRVDLIAMVSDDELIVDHAVYSADYAANRSQPIKEVRVYVNDHPHDATSSNNPGFVMNPLDGKYDHPDELAHLQLNMSLLPQGKHTLYFQATDIHDNSGPVSAVFVELKRLTNFDAASLESTTLGSSNSEVGGAAGGGSDADAIQSPSQSQSQQDPPGTAANPILTSTTAAASGTTVESSSSTATRDVGGVSGATTPHQSVAATAITTAAETGSTATSGGAQQQEVRVSTSESSQSSSSSSSTSSSNQNGPPSSAGVIVDEEGSSSITGHIVDQSMATIYVTSSASSSYSSRSSVMVMMMSGLLVIPMMMTMGASLWLLLSALI